MTTSFQHERRDYIRLPLSIPVRYKFLHRELEHPELERIHEGVTQNLGAGGLLLSYKIPDPAWLSELLTRRMLIGVNIVLPNSDQHIKALCRAAWASAVSADGGQTSIGLEFQEITQEDRDLITRHIIKVQMPS